MAKKTNIETAIETTEEAEAVAAVDLTQLHRDIIHSVLFVSLVVNLFFLVGWMVLQVTNIYDSQIAAFLFTR